MLTIYRSKKTITQPNNYIYRDFEENRKKFKSSLGLGF